MRSQKSIKRSKLAPWRTYIERYSLLKLLGEVRGKSVLDLACGEGFYSRLVRARGAARVVGVDLSSGTIGFAIAAGKESDEWRYSKGSQTRGHSPLSYRTITTFIVLYEYSPAPDTVHGNRHDVGSRPDVFEQENPQYLERLGFIDFPKPSVLYGMDTDHLDHQAVERLFEVRVHESD